jgi:hypothetical protein
MTAMTVISGTSPGEGCSFKKQKHKCGNQVANSVADPDHFDTDPDLVFHFDTDLDPAFHFYTDPNLTFHFYTDLDGSLLFQRVKYLKWSFYILT